MVKAFTNLPLLLVPVLTYKMPQSNWGDIDHAQIQHEMVQKAMAKHFFMTIWSLDHPLVSLNNATFCSTLMVVKALDGKHLILSVDCSWNGQGFSFVFPAKYHLKAQEFMEYLAKYLQHKHGNAVFCWFTPVAEAKEMGWDEHLQQLILQDGIDLKVDLKHLDFEWCIPNEAPTKIDLTNDTPVDMDNMSLWSFPTIGDKAKISHLAGPSTHISSPLKQCLTTQHPSSVTVTSDNLTSDSMIATHLSALETNWQLILQCLDKLAKMGKPPNLSGMGSTSTSPNHLSLGPAQTDLGVRL